MTQHADQPLLVEQPGAESTPPKRRRAPAAKTADKAPVNGSAPAKPRARRTTKKGSSETPELLPVENAAAEVKPFQPEPEPPNKVKAPTAEVEAPSEAEPAARTNGIAKANGSVSEPGEVAPAPTKTRRSAPRTRRAAPAGPAVTSPRDAHHQVEEWSPTRAKPAAEPASAPMEPPAPAPAAATPLQEPTVSAPEPPLVRPTEAAAVNVTNVEAPPPAQPARKYPVYIPRHVAKQMEEQGQTAPLAVPADAIPESARAAVEAAQAAQASRSAPPQRPESLPQHPQQAHPNQNRERGDHRGDRNRGDRGGDRHREHGRNDRNDRHDRGDRNDRNDRNERPDREQDYVPNEGSLSEEVVMGEGIIEISGKGFGFLRDAKRSFAQHPQDIFVTPELVRKYNLRDGQWIKGETRRGGRGAQLCKITEINGDAPDNARILPAFDELTVVSPMERVTLYTTPERTTTRIIDLFAPIGKGQRGLIVAPPRTGKTTLLQHIADGVVKNHPDITLIILLVDERPEEVTDIKRTIPSAEIMASSNDMDVKSHTRIAQLAIERAKRLVESGKDVFVLLDSITRVGRAFNNAMANGGRTMSGGVDSRALEIPRRLFAAARNTEEAGSLTIIATALIETGSKADELIFQEFKGTGNMELVLDRKISDQRIYPAIDIFQSGTRREELLIPADDLHKIAIIRRGLAGHKPLEAIERLLYFLRKFPTDSQMLREIPG